MAFKGRVSLNPNDATYDVGARLNLQQIFGKPLGARCLLPLPPRSLDTDGLTFPLNKRYEQPDVVPQPAPSGGADF